MSVPFAVHLTGDPTFPHNGDVTTDVTISAPTTWTEANYPGRVVALDRLDVDDVLTLQGGPWFIFCETLDFGAAGEIRGDGPSGAGASAFSADYARGATTVSARAQGGCGGVMVFIAANTITGTSGRPISANGGAGYRTTSNAASEDGYGGQGAFSPSFNCTTVAEQWDGTALNNDTYKAYLHPFAQLLGRGGGDGGFGGGSGRGGSGILGAGGSGIGGGGGGGAAGLPIVSEPSVVALIELALAGCLGGGGGGIVISVTGGNNSGGGGGGGAVVVWCKTLTATPTLSADAGVSTGIYSNAAAGVTYLIDVP